MLSRTFAFVLGLLVVACGEAPEQEDGIIVHNQAGTAPRVAGPAPAEVRGNEFVSTVSSAYRFEIESARMAAAKGDRADVKAFAQSLTAAFESSLASLDLIARAGGVQPAAVAGATHESDLAILSSTKGAPLDRAFVEQQHLSLMELLGLVRAYKNGGDNPQLKAWAETSQAMIADQLDKVQTLRAVIAEADTANAGS